MVILVLGLSEVFTSPWWEEGVKCRRRFEGGDAPPPRMGSLLDYPLVKREKSNFVTRGCVGRP